MTLKIFQSTDVLKTYQPTQPAHGLPPLAIDDQTFHPQYGYLFNSYYEAVGTRYFRSQRGLLSRSTMQEVYRYRADVDDAMGV
ncbi:hypothetical protein [Lyngbya confervoides]|uniref:Uncharacterized protein n=1 Tax=Lyngbya confervoides BDU141951 TaxID=1574623 RepID=A0ABD4SYH3_9CYAN|nr:hypothetical protein [Lyngbya confervoides]MCM1981221.1 hypothetical protein [Lyngbya confervoides BDU141951]